MSVDAVSFTTSDGVALEGEWHVPATPTATVVLCHPHPRYGGTMRSILTSALFDRLPRERIATLRFNFRGVEGSGGTYSEGRDEPNDVRAALDLAVATGPAPVAVVGWSFGADMALTVADDARIAGWVAIAPPLRFRTLADYHSVGLDTRPKLLILAAHDEFRAPAEVAAEVADWQQTRVEVVAGASHFFVGRADRVVVLTTEFVSDLAG